jgi:hypothetical protein
LWTRFDPGDIRVLGTFHANHPLRLGSQAARGLVLLLLLPGPFTIVFLSRWSASSCQIGPPLPAGLSARTPAPSAARSTAFVPAAARASVRRLRTRFIDRHTTASELGLVQIRDRLLRLFISSHFDEGEPARPTGCHVAHDAHGIHGANAAEQLFELGFRDVIRKISNKQLTTHSIYSCIPRLGMLPYCRDGRAGGYETRL